MGWGLRPDTEEGQCLPELILITPGVYLKFLYQARWGPGKAPGHRLLRDGTEEGGGRTVPWSGGSEAARTVWREASMETWEPGVGKQGQEMQIWEWQPGGGT